MSIFVANENGLIPFPIKTQSFSTAIEEAQAIAKTLPITPVVPHPDCRPGWSACFASSRNEYLPFTSASAMLDDDKGERKPVVSNAAILTEQYPDGPFPDPADFDARMIETIKDVGVGSMTVKVLRQRLEAIYKVNLIPHKDTVLDRMKVLLTQPLQKQLAQVKQTTTSASTMQGVESQQSEEDAEEFQEEFGEEESDEEEVEQRDEEEAEEGEEGIVSCFDGDKGKPIVSHEMSVTQLEPLQPTPIPPKSNGGKASDDCTLTYDVKKRKINLRFAHYPTYEPILLELEVEPTITLKSLRDKVEEALIADEYCRMKMCTNWFTEVKIGDSSKRLALTTTDTETLKNAGLDDETVIYLEGPLSGSSHGVDTAIAIVNSHGKKQAAQQNELLNFLVTEMKAMRESQTHLLKVIEDQQKQIKLLVEEQNTKFSTQVESLTAKVEEVKNTLSTMKITADEEEEREDEEEEEEEEEDEEDYEERYKEAQLAAKVMLARAEYAGQPLKAFWDVLCDEKKYIGPYLARAIVHDQRCGIERTTTDEEARTINNKNYNFCGATPLVLASHANRIDVMEELILDGANMEATTRYGYSALRVAVMNDNASAVELLLGEGASAGNAMSEAVSLGKAAAIGALIDKGESFGQPCYVGPLHNAAAAGHAAALEVMIKKGAYVDMPMSTKKTPLHYAAANGRLAAIELLVSKGANVELRDRDGQTPLMMLSRYGLSQEEQSRAVALLTPKVRTSVRAAAGAHNSTNSGVTTLTARHEVEKPTPTNGGQFGGIPEGVKVNLGARSTFGSNNMSVDNDKAFSLAQNNNQYGYYQQPRVPALPTDPVKVTTEPPRQQMTWNEFQHSVGGQGYTKKEISAMYWEYKASFYK